MLHGLAVHREAVVLQVLDLLRQGEPQEVLRPVHIPALGADSRLHQGLEAVLKGREVPLDIIHHGHGQHAVRKAAHPAEGELRLPGQAEYAVGRDVLRI